MLHRHSYHRCVHCLNLLESVIVCLFPGTLPSVVLGRSAGFVQRGLTSYSVLPSAQHGGNICNWAFPYTVLWVLDEAILYVPPIDVLVCVYQTLGAFRHACDNI